MKTSKQTDESTIDTSLVNTIIPVIQPFTGDMWSLLLVNAMRCLTEEQRVGLCFDLYCRSTLRDDIDKKIEQLKLDRSDNNV